MSTSIMVLDQNSNANNVDIMVFEPSVLFPPAAVFFWGGIDDMVQVYLPLDLRIFLAGEFCRKNLTLTLNFAQNAE